MLTQESVTRTNPGQSGAKSVKQRLALTSPTWVRGHSRALREGARPRGAKNREKQNSGLSPKPCQGVAHARARVGKIRLFDQPYNPRMQEQFSASGGKAVKLGPTGMRSASPEPPSACLKPRNTEIPLLPKSLSRGTARARAKSRFFDHPYNPRMLTQLGLTRTNPGKVGAKPESGKACTLPGVYRCSRCVTVRGPLLDGCRGLAEIISREISGTPRITGVLTGWLVSPWHQIRLCGSATGTSRVADSLACCLWVGIAPATLRSKNIPTVPALGLRGGVVGRGEGVFGRAATSLDCI